MAGVAVARLAREPQWEQLVAAYRAQLAFTLFLIALPGSIVTAGWSNLSGLDGYGYLLQCHHFWAVPFASPHEFRQ